MKETIFVQKKLKEKIELDDLNNTESRFKPHIGQIYLISAHLSPNYTSPTFFYLFCLFSSSSVLNKFKFNALSERSLKISFPPLLHIQKAVGEKDEHILKFAVVVKRGTGKEIKELEGISHKVSSSSSSSVPNGKDAERWRKDN